MKAKRVCGFNYHERKHCGKITSVSVWDRDGGYVGQRGSILGLLKMAISDMITYTHNLKPLRYCKRRRSFGKGMKNAGKILKAFENQPTYGYADNIDLGPSEVRYAKLGKKLD